jgi:hypothetical protein
MSDDRWRDTYDRWLTTNPADEFLGPDPRDPDPSRPPPFDYHNCYRCRDGEKPCVHGNPSGCEFLHARND